MINKILIITLSNIGDCILTLPAVDSLREHFPAAAISVIAGPKGQEIFSNSPYFKNFIYYNKHAPIKEKIKLIRELKKQNFDLVLDLRHTAFPLFLKTKHKTKSILKIPSKYVHMRDRHLYKLEKILGFKPEIPKQNSFYIPDNDYNYINKIIDKNNINRKDRIVAVSTGAATHLKRWSVSGFATVCDYLVENFNAQIIFVGDKKDAFISAHIRAKMKYLTIDLSGKTTLRQLAALLKNATLLISNDSAVMHLGSYLDVPTVAIFGPTDEKKYGPWSTKSLAVRKQGLKCAPCEKALCRLNFECMQQLDPEEVIAAAEKILKNV